MLSANIDRTPEGVLTFAGYDVTKLAKQYGTPLYLMDEERIRANCRMYLQAFHQNFGWDALPLYDGSAPHHLWKEEFGPLLAQKAIFDFEA